MDESATCHDDGACPTTVSGTDTTEPEKEENLKIWMTLHDDDAGPHRGRCFRVVSPHAKLTYRGGGESALDATMKISMSVDTELLRA